MDILHIIYLAHFFKKIFYEIILRNERKQTIRIVENAIIKAKVFKNNIKAHKI